jgi:hypothetical protein
MGYRELGRMHVQEVAAATPTTAIVRVKEAYKTAARAGSRLQYGRYSWRFAAQVWRNAESIAL